MFLSLIKKLVGLASLLVGLFFLFGTLMVLFQPASDDPESKGMVWSIAGVFAVVSGMFFWVGWKAITEKTVEQTDSVSQPTSTKPTKRWKHGRSISRVIGTSTFCASILLVWHSAACAKFVAEYRGDHTTEGAYAVIQLIPWVAIAGWLISFRLMWSKIESEKTFDAKGREQPTNRQGCGCLLSCALCLFTVMVWTPQLTSLEPPHVTAERLRQERKTREVRKAKEEQEARKEAEQREQDREFNRENRGKPDGYTVEKLKTLLRDKTMVQVRRLFGPPDDNAVIAGNEIWFYSNGIMNEATEKVDTLTVEFKKPLFSDSGDDSKVKNFGTLAGRTYKP